MNPTNPTIGKLDKILAMFWANTAGISLNLVGLPDSASDEEHEKWNIKQRQVTAETKADVIAWALEIVGPDEEVTSYDSNHSAELKDNRNKVLQEIRAKLTAEEVT